MKPRKWLALAASVSLVALLSAGLSAAAIQDEEEETSLEELMEEVTTTNNKINRNVRTPVAFKKSQADIVADAKKLNELAKKARKSEEAIKDAKDVENPKEKWESLMDVFIKTSEELAKVAEGGDQAKARKEPTPRSRSPAPSATRSSGSKTTSDLPPCRGVGPRPPLGRPIGGRPPMIERAAAIPLARPVPSRPPLEPRPRRGPARPGRP